MGAGSMVFSLPHFATGEYLELGSTQQACGAGNGTACSAATDGSGSSDVSRYLYVFLLAQVLHGIGAAPLWSLGIAYIDANVKKKLVSMFLGIYYTMALVGPAIGFLGGSTILNVHTDFMTADIKGLGLTPRSEGWVGAWWVGFFAASFITWLAAIPVLAFPRELPAAKELDADTSEMHGGRGAEEMEKIQNKLAEGNVKDLPHAVWGCLTNPTFLFISLAGSTDGAVLSGMSTFMPKFIQNQLALPASQAGLFTGAAALIGGATGTVLGGYLVKRLQLRCDGIVKLICVFSALSFVTTLVFLASGPYIPFAGVNVQYRNRSLTEPGWLAADSAARLGADCNSGCGCSAQQFSPLCGPDGVTYHSPCHAGCASTDFKDSPECRCFNEVATAADGTAAVPAPGRCESSCPLLPDIVIVQCLSAFFVFIGTSPSSTAIVRSVAPMQRPLAMGISTTVLRIFGTIPGPIMYGALIDRSCLLWSSPCDGPGSCLVYDNWWMSRYLLLATLCWKFASLVFYNLAWIFYKPPEGSEEYPVAKLDGEGRTAIERNNAVAPSNGGLENPAFEK